MGEGFPNSPAQLRLVGFKLGRLLRLAPGGKGGVLPVTGKLPFFLRPILALGDTLLAAAQKVNLVKPLAVAHLHDFGFQILHGCVCTAVLAACFPVRWSVHVEQHGNVCNPQGIDYDMHMDIFSVVMPVRVGQTRAWCPGKCSAQNFSPNSCARSAVKPLSVPSRGSKMIM